jgi:hypothetical protein
MRFVVKPTARNETSLGAGRERGAEPAEHNRRKARHGRLQVGVV